jgi:predicted N-formylglutamate amidohydrolase
MNRLLITCEHGGNRVPARYAMLFRGQRKALDSHRGFDPGAIQLAKRFASSFDAPLISSNVSRLVVELNRSLGHPRLFSEFTSVLDDAAKETLLDRYYYPYRNRVETWIADEVARGDFVLHLSVHSFTPELDGQVRTADVGLLYDPARPAERQYCDDWRTALRQHCPHLRVRRNYPYLGTTDGFTTYLRKRFGPHQYAGIELEVNQRFFAAGARVWKPLQHDVIDTFAIAWRQLPGPGGLAKIAAKS